MEKLSPSAASRDAPEGAPGSSGALRAVLSFLVFGSIGAVIGRWFGSYNDNHNQKLVKPFGTIAGGLIGGIVAAYGSMRSCAKEAEKQAPAPETLPPVPEPVPLPKARTKHDEARPVVQAQSALHEGELAPDSRSHELV